MSATLQRPDCAPDNEAKPRTAVETLAGGVAVMLLLTVVQRGIGFLRAVLFCRWLDADQLGEWDLALNFLMLAAPLAVLGLPGSFGRYVDHFRQRGQLRSFLSHVSILSIVLSTVAIAILLFAQPVCQQWVFGTQEHAGLMFLLAASLGAVIAFNFLISLFTALRHYRIISRMQLAQTVLFSSLGLGLLWGWQARVESVVVAFGIASLLVSIAGGWALLVIRRELPQNESPLSYRSLTVKLAPFAFWLWVTNWVSNLFEMVDRWLLVHFSGLDAVAALELVGQYHSARVLPVLLVGVGDLLATILTPHLSSDWESGQHARVSQRLNFVLKLAALGFTLVSVGLMIVSPLLFHYALEHKFEGGESILTWTLACSVWTALALIGFNYLWCAERSRWVSFTLAVGLASSVLMGCVLVPQYGIHGAVWSSAAAKFLALVLLAILLKLNGMAFDAKLIPLALVPLMLPLGVLPSLALIAILVRGLGPLKSCFNDYEWKQMSEVYEKVASKVRLRLPRAIARGKAGASL